MRISDWSSDVCSSDLGENGIRFEVADGDLIMRRERMIVAHDADNACPRNDLRFDSRVHDRVMRNDYFRLAVKDTIKQLVIGRQSCRVRVRPYVRVSVDAC